MSFKDKLQNTIKTAVAQGDVALYGADFEVLAELELGTVTAEEAEIAELEVMASLVEDAELSLQQMSEVVMASVADGGLSDQAITVVMAGVEAAGRPIGGVEIEMPSGEAFGQDGGRVEATEMAGESIKAKAKEMGGNVVKFLKSIIAKVREFYVTHLSKAGRTLKSAVKLNDMVGKLTGKAQANRFGFNLGALKSKDGDALTANQAAATTTMLSRIDGKKIDKAYDALASLLKSKDMGKVSEIMAACDAVGQAAIDAFALPKVLSEAERKKVGMGEKYAEVKGVVWMDGTHVAVGVPKADSAMGPRLVVVGTSPKQKDKEVETLSIGDIKAYAKLSKETLEASVELAKQGQSTTDSATKVADALGDFEKARKAADLEGDAKSKAADVKGKVKDAMTIATVGFKAFANHQQSVGVSAYNYALKSSKQYKKEDKEDK